MYELSTQTKFNIYFGVYLSNKKGLAFLQTRCSWGCSTNTFAINYLTDWLTDPFPPNLQHMINLKPLELGGWHFEIIFTPHQVLYVTCQVSHVRCHFFSFCFLVVFFGQSGWASQWMVCYQWGLPHLVSFKLLLNKHFKHHWFVIVFVLRQFNFEYIWWNKYPKSEC